MNLLFEKIIMCYIRITYLFGANLSKQQKASTLNTLMEATNYKLEQRVIDFLIQNEFNLRDTNMFLRRVQYYKMINGKYDNDIEREIVLIANEEIRRLKEIEISNEGVGMSLSSCQELLARKSKELTVANYIYGAAHCLGYFNNKDEKQANKYLLKAAHNYYIDAFLLLAINTKSEKDYYSLLYNALNKIGHKLPITTKKNELFESKVKRDLEIYNLINDDRSKNQLNLDKYNPFIEKVLFSNQFTIQEKQTWLFSKNQIEWNVICNLITTEKEITLANPKPNIRPLEKNQIRSVLEKMINTKNSSPLIIECKDELMLSEVKNYITNTLNSYYPIEINTKKFDMHTLQRNVAKNNFLYNATKIHNSNLIVTLIENLHVIKDNMLVEYNAFLYPDTSYYFYDIETEYKKENLLNVIFAKEAKALNNSLVNSSIILQIKEASEDEKEYLITRFLINKLKRIGEESIDVLSLARTLKEEANYTDVKEIVNTFITKALDANDLTNEKLIEIIKDNNSTNYTGKIGFVTRRIG